MFKNLSTGTKQITVAVFPLLAVIILFIIVGKFGLSKISEVRAGLAKAQKDRTILTQKTDILRTVSASVGESANAALGVLPESNPSLAVVSQIKLLALENSVLVSGIKSGPEIADKTGLLRTDISFDIIAPRDQMIAFIKATGNIAPVIVVDKIKLSENGGVERAAISVKSFWSPLPTKLPLLTTEITNLTEAEKQLITDMGSLRKPVFVIVPPSTGTGRTDPFSP